MKISLSLDFQEFNQKPNVDKQYKDYVSSTGKPISEVMMLSSRIAGQETEVDVEQLAEAISKGRSFCPATFYSCPVKKKPMRKNSLFKSSQLICLDFDNEFSFEYLESLCAEHSLIPCIIYESFSSQITPGVIKARAIFLLDESVTCSRKYEAYLDLFLKLFDRADSAVKDPARLLYGTNKSTTSVDTSSVISLEYLDSLLKKNKISVRREDTVKSKSVVAELSDEEFNTYWNSLTSKKKLQLKTDMSRHLFKLKFRKPDCTQSRYESIFKVSVALGSIECLPENYIVSEVLKATSANPLFDNYDKDIADIATSGVQWVRQKN